MDLKSRCYLIFPKSKVAEINKNFVQIDTEMTYEELIKTLMQICADGSSDGMVAVKRVENKDGEVSE